MRSDSYIKYRLGLLLNDYSDLEDECDGTVTLNDLYESFDDRYINDNPHLRIMAFERGKIDGLEYYLHGETPPTTVDCSWLNTNDPETLLRNLTEATTDAITDRGGAGTTWTDYLRGWVYAYRYILDPEERPWESQCYRNPDERIVIN